jgi:hypothetical protein
MLLLLAKASSSNGNWHCSSMGSGRMVDMFGDSSKACCYQAGLWQQRYSRHVPESVMSIWKV